MTAAPTRRRLLAGGAVVAGTTALSPAVQLVGGPAAWAAGTPTYPPASYATSKPTTTELHYLQRLGCGYSRATFSQLRANGSPAAWFEHQLTPSVNAESATAAALPSWFPDMNDSASTKWAKQAAGTKGGWQYAADLAGYSMLRQVYSSRQLLERMVAFWSNHLHVHADTDLGWVHRKSYDDTVRANALGRFEDLLVAAELHPAMLLYLDNWTSVRDAPNENQGRELLELHTVGRASGYTEAMVKDSARIMSGYTVKAFGTWDGFYDPDKHTTGAVQVLGFTSTNAAADGRQVTVDYLKYLANHPATAQTIARKLCRAFVADQPSDALVNTVATAFRSSGTDIKATLRVLVAHPDFAASHGRLLRNPVEDFVATCRVLGVAAKQPSAEDSFARTCIWLPQTTLLYQWPRPDGLPLGDAPWASATRLLNSFRMHWNLTAGWWPTKDVTYRSTGADWLPQPQMRLDQYVDHLSRMVLGKGSSSRLLTSVVEVTGCPPSTVVSSTHAVCTWLHVRVLGTLLDSPDHMHH